MSFNLHDIIDSITDIQNSSKPLIVNLAAFLVQVINPILGTIAFTFSMTYTIVKFYRDIIKPMLKNNKNGGNN